MATRNVKTRTVLSSLARTWWRAAESRGVDPRGILNEGLRARLEDVDGRLPYDALMAFVDELAARSADPFFGLRVADAYVDAATFGVVGFAARSCETLGDAIERTVRYAAVMNENTEIRLQRFDDVVLITDGPIAPMVWPRHYAEMALGSFVCLSRKWTRTPIDVVRASFQHPAPRDVSEHERMFSADLHFGQAQNQLVLPAAALGAPLHFADRDLRAYLDKQAQALASELGPAADWLTKLRNALLRALPGGAPTLRSAAHEVAMSERTLQRRLAEERLTYGALLDSVRKHAALGAIATKGSSVQEAGFMAGYVDMKAFRRAFHRWTGRSPQAYRRELRSGS